MKGLGSQDLAGEMENVKVLNGALQMTQNVVELGRPITSQTCRFPWSFPSLNLDRSYNQQATSERQLKYFMRLVAIGFAYSGGFSESQG